MDLWGSRLGNFELLTALFYLTMTEEMDHHLSAVVSNLQIDKTEQLDIKKMRSQDVPEFDVKV